MRIPVHDHDARPAEESQQPHRWQPESAGGPWLASGNGFEFDGQQFTPATPFVESGSVVWVAYQHKNRRGEVEEITDVYGYNRPDEGAKRNRIRDLVAACRLTIRRGQGEFLWEMSDGEQCFQCVFDLSKQETRLLVVGHEAPVLSAPLEVELTKRTVELEMSLVDRQVTVTVDGRPVLPPLKLSPSRRPGSPADSSAPTVAAPVRIGARGLQVRVDSLKLFRDVYYTQGRGNHAVTEPFQLGENEYFVLGDNSPVSSDSRSWPDGRVSERLLMGKPFVVHLPSRPGKLTIGKWVAHVRIPDFARMHYIR
jgi:hypothetical protein